MTDNTRQDEIPGSLEVPTACLETLRAGLVALFARLDEELGPQRPTRIYLFQGETTPLPRRPVDHGLGIYP